MRKVVLMDFLLVLLAVGISYSVANACATSISIIAPAEGSKATFNAATPGVKEISCDATAEPSDRIPYITWTSKNISGTEEIWSPDPPVGGGTNPEITLTLRTLPLINAYFGDTWVTASVDSLSDTHHFKLFWRIRVFNGPIPYVVDLVYEGLWAKKRFSASCSFICLLRYAQVRRFTPSKYVGFGRTGEIQLA